MAGSDKSTPISLGEESLGPAIEMTDIGLKATKKLANPLDGLSFEELSIRAEEYCKYHGITKEEDVRSFRLGAQLAGNLDRWDAVEGLTDEERIVLEQERDHKWKNPKMLYLVVASK